VSTVEDSNYLVRLRPVLGGPAFNAPLNRINARQIKAGAIFAVEDRASLQAQHIFEIEKMESDCLRRCETYATQTREAERQKEDALQARDNSERIARQQVVVTLRKMLRMSF
jgi:hypothetical protein